MLIVSAASLFGWVIAREQRSADAGGVPAERDGQPVRFSAADQSGLLVIGMVLEPVAALLITVPVLMPVATQFGIDPLHLGIVMILNLVIGLLSPPVGLVLYVLSSVTGASVQQVMRGTLPFLLPLGITLDHRDLRPAVSLWLPQLLGMSAVARDVVARDAVGDPLSGQVLGGRRGRTAENRQPGGTGQRVVARVPRLIEIGRLLQRYLFDVRQQKAAPESPVGCADAWRKRVQGVVILVQRHADLAQAALALDPPCRLPSRLDGRQQEGDQDTDHGDADQHLDQRKAAFAHDRSSPRDLTASASRYASAEHGQAPVDKDRVSHRQRRFLAPHPALCRWNKV
jgi:hypothetical protein